MSTVDAALEPTLASDQQEKRLNTGTFTEAGDASFHPEMADSIGECEKNIELLIIPAEEPPPLYTEEIPPADFTDQYKEFRDIRIVGNYEVETIVRIRCFKEKEDDELIKLLSTPTTAGVGWRGKHSSKEAYAEFGEKHGLNRSFPVRPPGRGDKDGDENGERKDSKEGGGAEDGNGNKDDGGDDDDGGDSSKDNKPNGKNRDKDKSLVMRKNRAELLLSFVNKGPQSKKGMSMNKALKRYFRERMDSLKADLAASKAVRAKVKAEEEKELRRGLRMKRNKKGEIVLFYLDESTVLPILAPEARKDESTAISQGSQKENSLNLDAKIEGSRSDLWPEPPPPQSPEFMFAVDYERLAQLTLNDSGSPGDSGVEGSRIANEIKKKELQKVSRAPRPTPISTYPSLSAEVEPNTGGFQQSLVAGSRKGKMMTTHAGKKRKRLHAVG
jgi:hypothetical protein